METLNINKKNKLNNFHNYELIITILIYREQTFTWSKAQ